MHYISLDKTIKVPLYQQLYQSFEAAIKNNILRDTEQLPTEEALCQYFDISHYIVRHAYDALLQDGLIIRIKGKGSFVSRRKKIISSLGDLRSLESQLRLNHENVECHIQLIEEIEDDPEAFSVLHLEERTKVNHARRLLISNGFVMYAQDWYLPESIFPKIRKRINKDQRWIDVLDNIVPIASITNHFSARQANAVEAMGLGIEANDPVFINRATLHNRNGEVVGFVKTLYPGDYTRMQVRL